MHNLQNENNTKKKTVTVRVYLNKNLQSDATEIETSLEILHPGACSLVIRLKGSYLLDSTYTHKKSKIADFYSLRSCLFVVSNRSVDSFNWR